jgi:hypothetical protein
MKWRQWFISSPHSKTRCKPLLKTTRYLEKRLKNITFHVSALENETLSLYLHAGKRLIKDLEQYSKLSYKRRYERLNALKFVTLSIVT